MIFIELAQGISVSRDKIESVEEDGSGSKVRINGTVYISTFPYKVLLQILESDNGVQKVKEEKETLNIFKQIATPAW
jgi:hypothetical protein